MILRYENHLGAAIDLSGDGYSLHENDLLDYEWAYTLTGRPGGTGSVLRNALRQSAQFKATLGIAGDADTFPARMNALLAITEPDTLAQLPGKLWRDDQYIRCFVVSSDILLRIPRYAVKRLGIVAVDPFWTTESTQYFYPATDTITGGKKYNLKYPYRFGSGYVSTVLYNSHYADTPMVITFYGPASNPSITIGANVYAMVCELATGERVEIDQVSRTITKIGTTGVKTSLFNSRNKSTDIFLPAPVGNQSVLYNGGGAIGITLLQRRSEPLWT